MHINRTRRIGIASCAVMLCLLGTFVGLHAQREPRYEGQPLSYWLNRLEPTVDGVQHWPDQKFRSKAAVSDWIARTDKMQKRSSQIFRAAGPECLPMLLARLTAKPTSVRSGRLRRWAYTLHLSDSAPFAGWDDTEVRRGQALTAIILLQDRAASLVPRLSVLAAEDKDDSIHRAASFALYIVAPDEFRRIRAPAKTLPDPNQRTPDQAGKQTSALSYPVEE